jgi:hypothetical protein
MSNLHAFYLLGSALLSAAVGNPSGDEQQARRRTHGLHEPPGERESKQSERKCCDQEPTLHVLEILRRA